MKYYDFEYDGLNLSDKGFIICEFGSSGLETLSNGSVITFNTVSVENGQKSELTGTKYNECLSTTFTICKNLCLCDNIEISVSEARDLMKWLNRKEFHKFRFLDSEYLDFYFESTFNLNKIKFNGNIIGFELNMITNRPFAIHEAVTLNVNNLKPSSFFEFDSLSDEEGFIYPKMKITIEENGNLQLKNETENRIMSINNCKVGEIINIEYPIIKTSLNSHKIQNDFNWKFFRITNNYKNSTNKITTTLQCSIVIEYNPIIKISL